MVPHNHQGSCLPKNLDQIWDLAYVHATQSQRITGDVQRIKTLDVKQVTGTDFMGQCAWAIYGAGFKFDVLAPKWPELQAIYLHWDVQQIVEQAETVKEAALKIIGHQGKVEAILTIAGKLSQGWPDIRSTLLDLLSWDANGIPVETQPFIKYLDALPWVGEVLASYIAKNIGVDSIKPDLWMLRLAKWLEYKPGKSGVWDMARDFQSLNDERINVIDTVCWNWAKDQDCLKEVKL
jgi:hypothetical protein